MFVENGPQKISLDEPIIIKWKENEYLFCYLNAKYPDGRNKGRKKQQQELSGRLIMSNWMILPGFIEMREERREEALEENIIKSI